MNGYRPTIGIEYDDKYKNAKSKLIDFLEAMNELTPAQRAQFARECAESIGKVASLGQFINHMNNGGRW